MPIDPEQVPVLIKQSEVRRIERWKRDYFEKIVKELQVHTKGQLFAKVATLFPNEHPSSRAHCLATYEPITKSAIWKGINNVLRIFSSSSFSINVGDDLTKWLEDYEYGGHNILNYFLEMWVHKAVAEDPNGLFVIYPVDWAAEKDICPVQWVRSEFIKSRTSDGVSFISEMDSEVTYHYDTSVQKRAVYYDESVEQVNARTFTETTYNQRLKVKVVKEVVHLFTKDGFIIYKRAAKDNQFEVTKVDFAEPLSSIPVFPGGGPVADRADELLFESFVQAFVPFGNLALLQHRNHRAVDLQFSYPRMMELQTPCSHQGCVGGRVKMKRPTVAYPDGFMPCPAGCKDGFITVQSPYKVYNPRYDPNDQNENKHLNVDPVKFFSPDVSIINYSKDAWKDYLKMAEVAIFVLQKKDTGNVETVEAKNRDLDEMFAWLNGVSKVFYNNMRLMLQALEEYISRNPTNVSVERPYSYAILTESEAFLALNNILMSNAPVFIKGNQVETFVTKFVSKDSPVIRALAILKQYDPLLFYNTGEVQTFKSSNVVTQEMWTKHVLAYPIMLKLYMKDKGFLAQSDEVIITALDTEIANFKIPAAGEDFRRAILASITTEEEAAA